MQNYYNINIFWFKVILQREVCILVIIPDLKTFIQRFQETFLGLVECMKDVGCKM